MTALSRHARRRLRTEPELLDQLPRHEDGAWKLEDTDLAPGQVNALRREGVVEVVGIDADGGNYRKRWRTAAAVDEWAAQHSAQPTTPCGHTGIRTLVAGEEYTCGREGCDETFGRAVAEEVVG